MASFQLTEHAVMRFKLRHKRKDLSNDNFALYVILKKQIEKSSLSYVSEDRQTYYYELPDYPDLYFVVAARDMICATIKPLSYTEKLKLDYPTNR